MTVDSKPTITSYDITIVGGGFVGLSLALLLSQLSHKILLIESKKNNVKSGPPSFDARSIALSLSSIAVLQKIGLWVDYNSFAAPIKNIHISEKKGFAFSQIKAADYDLPALGYVVEAQQLLDRLQLAVNHKKNITQLAPATVTALEEQESGVFLKVKTDNQELEVNTKLLVAADGLKSSLREMLNIKSTLVDYNQFAVVANVAVKKFSEFTAYERFTENGPMALLPLTDNRYALIWSRTKTDAVNLLNTSESFFIESLQKEFGYRLGRFTKIGQRQMFPLVQSIAQTQCLRRSILLGSSAYHLHPVAGQGLNLCLRDVMQLVELISNHPLDNLLTQFNQMRVADQKRVQRFTHGLIQLFKHQNLLSFLLRNSGLFAFELLDRIKEQVVKHATGLAGNELKLTYSDE